MANDLTPQDLTGLDEDRIYAVMAYLNVLVLVPLLIKRDRPFVLFHAKQGLVLLIGFIIAIIAAVWISAVGSSLFIVLMIVNIIALVQALLGRRWKIPLLGDLARKFTI